MVDQDINQDNEPQVIEYEVSGRKHAKIST